MYKFRNIVVAPVILAFTCFFNFASAGLIFTDNTPITVTGQNDNNVIDVTGFEGYTDLLFTIQARGDYGNGNSHENISFFIDGVSFGIYNWATAGSVLGTSGNVYFDWVVNYSFVISDIDWANFTSDSLVEVDWENSDTVGSSSSFYVNYSLTGEPSMVPEPFALTIFALGLMCICVRRFINLL